MSYPVHILVSDPKGDFGMGSRWVFSSIRVGFPTAKITSYFNNLSEASLSAAISLCELNGIGLSVGIEGDKMSRTAKTIHHKWISHLIGINTEPFWICDTDIHFWGSMEGVSSPEAIAGRRIPEWRDEWSGCVTRARIHPSLMLIFPNEFKTALNRYSVNFPVTEFNPHASFVDPITVAFGKEGYFYDTMAMAYQAIGGRAFTSKELDLYDHMNFGTLEHLIIPSLKNGAEMKALRDKIYENPALGRGMWRHQEQYYANHPV